MQVFQTLFTRLFRRDPEKLWIHYLFAMSLFAALLVANTVLQDAVVGQGATATDTIQKSNRQIALVTQAMQAADGIAMGDAVIAAALAKTARQMAANYSVLTKRLSDMGIAPIQETGMGLPIDRRMREFIAVAQKLSQADNTQQGEIAPEMRRLFGQGALTAGLISQSSRYAAAVNREMAQYRVYKNCLQLLAVLLVIAEAIFVFWPAQTAVRATIQKMKRQTLALTRAKARLEQMNGQLKNIARHDALTGLPNRTYVTEYLINTVRRRWSSPWQIYLLGLDDFKAVNDAMGHDVGDALLISVGNALQGCVNFDDLAAHVGGDNFVLITDEESTAVLRRIADCFAIPIRAKGRSVQITASIGYLAIGSEVREPLEVLADAEMALQFAKTRSGGSIQEFTNALRDELSSQQQLQWEIRQAIADGEIEPWFQPQIRLADGTLHGAEVLARWRHPTRGLLTPDVFLPAAERAGLMIELDHEVWRLAMQYAHLWGANGLWQPLISVNAAPDTIADPHLVERFLLLLRKSGLNTDQVALEVLETTLINGKDDIAAVNIDSLAECGISLELDDFGTGYASLSKLTQLPLAGIKLDRSLIDPLPDHCADSVVRAILALASELNLHVVAEGIEKDVQARHLAKAGCGIGQGYGFGKPMSPDAFRDWLAARMANNTVPPAIQHRA
ncbi:MAG: putative bifunctional diguanylate cyclase/phosphodiesterase [Yoonia sp.]|uniref:putative bifunctional diguanylate cyclase/phosphodiesterase n=1 Tax=Yoonia sp. TaxID=2212373 RepID=UPI003EF6D1A9